MTDPSKFPHRRPNAPISRRLLLAGSLATAAGCQVDTGSEGGSGFGSESKIEIPDFDTKLPTEDVTFRWCDSGGLKSVYEKAVLDAFTKKHANITTDYQGSGWDTVNQVIPLGIRNENAPDIFALPNNVPSAIAVNEGWVQPLEDLVPDFEAWKTNFGENAFVPGVHVFNDRIYSFPMNSDRRLEYMMIYDQANLAAAGYDDPVNQIETWDDIYAALKKVVGTGKVGLMWGSDATSTLVAFLAQTAGWRTISGIDLRTGRYAYDAPQVLQAFEFFQKLVTDKLIVPGFLSLKIREARSQMSAGQAGLMFNGPWDIPAWKKTAPGWKYVIGKVPNPDGTDYVVPFEQNGANNPWVYAKTKLPTVAGQILAYMGSPDGQKMAVIHSEGNLQSLNETYNQAADQPGLLDPNAETARDLANAIMRAGPQAALRNPDVARVTLARKEVVPTWKELMIGIVTGEVTGSPERLFAEHNAAQQESLEQAIETARKEGATVSQDDWVFPNWDPTKDYTKADYEALG